MRPIKFRGRRIWDAGYSYGDIVQSCTNYVKMGDWLIEPESVAQFIGVDSNGAEVYEGDILIDELENETVAEIYDRPEKIARLTLKR